MMLFYVYVNFKLGHDFPKGKLILSRIFSYLLGREILESFKHDAEEEEKQLRKLCSKLGFAM